MFAGLIEPSLLERWILPEGLTSSGIVVEPRVGGKYSYGWRYPVGGKEVEGGPTRIIELEPNRKLVTDWPDWRGEPTVPPTTVTWLLEAEGTGTRLTLIHGPFSRPVDQSDYRYGWGGFLDLLKRELEAVRTP